MYEDYTKRNVLMITKFENLNHKEPEVGDYVAISFEHKNIEKSNLKHSKIWQASIVRRTRSKKYRCDKSSKHA